MLVIIVAVGLAVLVVVLPALLPRGERNLIGAPSSTPGLPASPRPSAAAVATAEVTYPPLVSPRASATSAPRTSPPTLASPTMSLEPTPGDTPSPEPTPPPTPQPTPKPTPPPAPAETVTVGIDDDQFAGDYDRGSKSYLGRSVSWVYGQGTQWHTMSAGFRLPRNGEILRRASIRLVGLDGEDEGKSRIAIALNGVTVYRGPNPLPDDACCDDNGEGNWGSAKLSVPGRVLARENTLTIANLEPSDCTRCPTYVMIDYAELIYRVRPRR